jgi:hypothetical protein
VAAKAGPVLALILGAAFLASMPATPGRLDAWSVPAGVGLLVLCEALALVSERRRAATPGVPLVARLAPLVLVVAVAGGVAAVVAALVTAPVGDALVLAALGAAGVVLAVAVLLSLAGAASRSSAP